MAVHHEGRWKVERASRDSRVPDKTTTRAIGPLSFILSNHIRSWKCSSMLITPRTYSASQTPDHGAALTRAEAASASASRFHTLAGWRQNPTEASSASEMLLVHQIGSVRVGEIARLVPHAVPCCRASCACASTSTSTGATSTAVVSVMNAS